MDRELNVVLTVMAKGYDVTVEINGKDMGIRGQKSESVKLFGQGDPMAAVLPQDMKNQACLQEGDNSIRVLYKRLADTDLSDPPELTIELMAREQFVNGAPLFSRKEKGKAGLDQSFTDVFNL